MEPNVKAKVRFYILLLAGIAIILLTGAAIMALVEMEMVSIRADHLNQSMLQESAEDSALFTNVIKITLALYSLISIACVITAAFYVNFKIQKLINSTSDM